MNVAKAIRGFETFIPKNWRNEFSPVDTPELRTLPQTMDGFIFQSGERSPRESGGNVAKSVTTGSEFGPAGGCDIKRELCKG